MIRLLVLIVLLAARAYAADPYVHPIEPEGEVPAGIEVRVEEASETDIFFSRGYERARIVGKRIDIKGAVLNHSEVRHEALRVVFRAEDLFGETLAACEVAAGAVVPGGDLPFECSLEVKVASDLHRVRYSVSTGAGDP